ncbi:hypothetical protein ScalyP_jg5185 [Parmales sp. scaly parma]|nr:hypothetical protein ScalyP_jg5185 [Parmales sp. scaly parma]
MGCGLLSQRVTGHFRACIQTAPSLTADPTATARCYFERASKEVTYLEEVKGVIDDQADSTRTSVLAQSSLLAKFASHYLHPEQNPVTTSSNCCRSWFNRPTSQEEAMEDDDNAHSEILADAETLKSWASAYSLNAPPITSGPGARSFFSRPRAPTNEPAVEPALPPQLDRSRALSDQFEMEGFGSSIMSTTKFVVQSLVIGGFEEHDEGSDEDISDDGSGKLSRSPSSIMLFEQGAREAN